ncbi:hypothetical protein [Paracoccus aminophilus]|uniref:DUF998 domain-containing protein n=1 Tax=Paracoccus aminophilus JCM 7686 TaxID=1367847 RepID=S5XQB9_PARAH|nr:hypothetical protein [Paracoccus aminophilus]AGT07247.1 hypothetical protein JCM7686_0136 [Paracoccus aminophilus JCM 7686]
MSDHASGADQKAENDLVLSFLAVRRALGLLGYVLPAVLILYGLFDRQWALASISAYFYSPLRELFVGILCAQAVFLWNYEGYKPDAGEILSDKMVSRAASLGALIVAFAPMAPSAKTAPPGGEAVAPVFEPTLLQTFFDPVWVGRLHFLGALLFFGALATYCLVNFRRGGLDDPLKCAANRIYGLCGWVILACILAIAALSLFGFSESAARFRAVFWLEVVACVAFATSWAVKGQALQPLVRQVAAQSA